MNKRITYLLGAASFLLLTAQMPMQAQSDSDCNLGENNPPCHATYDGKHWIVSHGEPPTTITAGEQCAPMEGGQQRTWTCNGRHTVTFSDPQTNCQEIGRTTICERE